ncbi:proton channel OTOP3-like [Betta splendens]|uniref:Proton channel OTOP3-like n=1 Tax=Betta splendens TaxID=158456 RepID=A0A6P7L6P8_BETSP|nr:proton channel OTOP3-like [Betta splendens]XP_028989669.1 proton channel OTOP3-like [Betta splendens]XP_028989670.1 proton channel OTOP3-like [Betta splendens]XP_028989672.1 proton channel OTOP3-like [Betta splendens]
MDCSMSEKPLEAEWKLKDEDKGLKTPKNVVRRNTKGEHGMNPDVGKDLDCVSPTSDGLDSETQELDPVVVWVPSKRHLVSGLLGLNLFLLGMALVAGQALNPEGLKHEEPEVFIVLLIGLGLLWMLWYLLWARNRLGISPHKDHHAGGVTVMLVLLLFAAVSLLLSVFKMGYLVSLKACMPTVVLITPFMEAPFLALQTYLLWAHCKDCIHKHKLITRFGLMLILSADLLMWLNAVTDDTIHEEIELEKAARGESSNATADKADASYKAADNSTLCECSASAACLIFRKGFEVLYPFNMEYYLMAACMVYVMWKNVGRSTGPAHGHATHTVTLRVAYGGGGGVYGLALGALVLSAGVTVFVLYQVWVSHPQLRLTAFLLFYGYHLAVMPVMCLCSLAGMLIHRLERRAREAAHNPTRNLDVILLVAAAVGQFTISYFSLVAALAVGTEELLGDLDLSFSLLSLLELILQNIFIIEGLHRHPSLLAKKKEKRRSTVFKLKKKVSEPTEERKTTDVSLLEADATAPPAVQQQDGTSPWTKRAMQEICAFLILSNIMLWIIPAFGVHPQFENGLGKQFFGLTAWFVVVNLGQPLGVFYRMHSVGALMELFLTA